MVAKRRKRHPFTREQMDQMLERYAAKMLEAGRLAEYEALFAASYLLAFGTTERLDDLVDAALQSKRSDWLNVAAIHMRRERLRRAERFQNGRDIEAEV